MEVCVGISVGDGCLVEGLGVGLGIGMVLVCM